MARMVIIEHRDGRRYAVTPGDYRRQNIAPEGEERRTYEESGFRIVSWETGEPYEETRATPAATKADESKK